MGCTCRALARCPVCNTSVRVPLSNLEQVAKFPVAAARTPRRDGSSMRSGFRYLIEGSSACPRCGHSVHMEHSRSCVSKALVGAGIPSSDRALILARITFPEG